MNRNERDDAYFHQDKRGSDNVKAHQLLGSGMKEDEVQELAEHHDDGWEYVDEP